MPLCTPLINMTGGYCADTLTLPALGLYARARLNFRQHLALDIPYPTQRVQHRLGEA
jgi:hypothetical protein